VTSLSAAVSVRFERHEVAIRSDAPEALEALRRSFRYMEGTGTGETIAEVEVTRAADGFVGRSALGTYPHPGPLSDVVRWARYQAIEHLIQARPDLVWLHGAAAGRRGRAALMPGRRGRGKSTLVTRLCRRGWSFLTDDIVPIDPDAFRILPFPQLPAIRPDPGRDLPESWLRQVEKDEVPVDERVEPDPLPVGVLVLPEAVRSGETTLEACSSAEAVRELAPGCWNFAEHGARAVEVLARLVTGRPSFRIRFRDADRAADLVTEWADAAWPRPGPA
jgi:hypothetical protein